MSDIIWLAETRSTNDDAKAFAQNPVMGVPARWIGAGLQTAGRGRGSRNWESPTGNLYASWVGQMDCDLSSAAQLSFVAALSVASSVLDYMPKAAADLSFKWPNDVLLGGKKFCGILLEAEQTQNLWLIVGIGVNLKQAPTQALYPATALGIDTPPQDFLKTLASHFETLKELWQKQGFGEIKNRWLARAQGVGEKIRVRLPQKELEGVFQSLNARGALTLSTPEGVVEIEAGDVFFV